MDEKELELELNKLDKQKLITLFIKLKRINAKLMKQNYLLENEIIESTSLEDLIEDIGERSSHDSN